MKTDGWVIAAEVRSLRQVHKGAILILEGQTDDKALAKFIDKKECIVQISFGKRNAIKALDLLKERGVSGVVALVDADFDRINGVSYNLDNLNMTDHHDLDMTLFLSSALEHVLNEKADGAKLNKNCKGSVDALVETVLSSAEELSCCRYVSRQRRLMLNFKDLKFDFIGTQDISCNSDRLITAIIANSPASRCDAISLKEFVREEVKKKHDLRQLTCGHDVAAILGIALRCFIGNLRPVRTWASEMEANLRLAFDHKSLRATIIFAWFSNWEGRNPPYKIITQDDVVT